MQATAVCTYELVAEAHKVSICQLMRRAASPLVSPYTLLLTRHAMNVRIVQTGTMSKFWNSQGSNSEKTKLRTTDIIELHQSWHKQLSPCTLNTEMNYELTH